MEIIKRKNHGDEGEQVPWNAGEKAVRDEVNHRTHKAGYTDRDGQVMTRTIMTTVPCGTEKLNVWPRDENGQLIDD